MAVVVATQPQEMPLWARGDIWEEGGSDLEFPPLGSQLIGIEDDGLSKATEGRKVIEDQSAIAAAR
jgi:hypothetical protein